jgi:predicted kinase
MTIVHLTTGLPASGKSTHARQLDALRFSLDDHRAMMGIGRETWSNEKEAVAIEALMASATAAIKSGYDIVIDNTHLVPRLPRMYRKEFSSLGAIFQIHDFTHVTVEECIERDANREVGHVGEDVIRKLALRHVDACKNGWRLTDKWMNIAEYVMPKPYEPDLSLPSAIIVDIDGTVAIHGDERGHYDYDKIGTDTPNHSVIDLVGSIADSDNYMEAQDPDRTNIIFLSGREDRCMDDTKAWLDRYVGSTVWDELFMRKTGDHRPDYIIKQELFDAHIRNDYCVWLVLDDRDQVVKMWREMGLTCLQVAPGDF